MPRKTPKKKSEKLILGLDLGGTKLASGVVTNSGKVLDSSKVPVDLQRGKEGFLRLLEKTVAPWFKAYPKIKAIGIASCGPLDVEKGVLLNPTNFPDWGRLYVASFLKRKFKVPVVMNNDAAAVSGAEGWVGGAKKLKNWVNLTLGTGLGTGIVLDREVFLGGSGQGPEAGHLIISDKPYQCSCGQLGCAESVLSGKGLMNRIRERSHQWTQKKVAAPKSPKELLSYAENKDPIAENLLMEFSIFFARAVHNYSVVFRPQKIFISGGASPIYFFLAKEIEKQIALHLKHRPGFEPPILKSKLGPDFGVLAGAWVAHARLF